ncbi:unnamed protein product, partial [marine sediment metagenome]
THSRISSFTCTVQKLNPSAVSPAEFIVIFDDGSMSSEYCKDYEPIDFRWVDLWYGPNGEI